MQNQELSDTIKAVRQIIEVQPTTQEQSDIIEINKEEPTTSSDSKYK